MNETKIKLLKDMEDFIANKINDKLTLLQWRCATEEMGGYVKIAQSVKSWEIACTLFGLCCKKAGVIE